MGWGGEEKRGFPRGSWKGYAKANTEGNDPIAKGLSFLMIVLTRVFAIFFLIKMRISKSAMSDMIQKLGSYHHFWWYFCPEVFKEGKSLKWKHPTKMKD